jgi:hypothetical protein
MISIKNKFRLLLASLLFFLVVFPFITDGHNRIILTLFLSGILLATLYFIHVKHGHFYFSLSLNLLSIIMLWGASFTQSSWMLVAGYGFMLGYLTIVLFIIVRAILAENMITTDLIYGAISGYLLVGIVFGLIFFLLEHAFPGSIVMTTQLNETTGKDLTFILSDTIYFSFTSLTTLGFGDFVPISNPARNISYLEAVVGQIYLTVFIARLVGLHIISPNK